MIARQTRVLDQVLDGMQGKLTNAKWAAIGQCSADTALRDINDLLERGVLRRLEGGVVGYGVCVGGASLKPALYSKGFRRTVAHNRTL